MSFAIAVVGDLMLDHYIYGDVSRISPEAPVPIMRVEHELFSPGGAAHVAASIQALNQPSLLMAPISVDDEGKKLSFLLNTVNVACNNTEMLGWSTTVKTRLVASGHQLVRFDRESPLCNSPSYKDYYQNVAFRLQHMAQDLKAIVVSDYDKGAVSADIRTAINSVKIANPQLPIMVDCKPNSMWMWSFADVITPNFNEACKFLGCDNLKAAKEDSLCENMAKQLTEKLPGLKLAVITRAQHGCSWYYKPDNWSGSLPAFNTCKADVIGAGDTFIAALTVAMTEGKPIDEAVVFANAASAIAVSKGGTTLVHRMELDEYLTNTFTDNATVKKIKTQNAAIDWARQLKSTGEKLVFANGCFDLLHTGHVYMLEKAKSLGTKLIVAVNDDASIKALKGSARPIVPLADRMKMLAALESVDCVVPFSHHDLEQLLDNLKPKVLVKGSEYEDTKIPGASVVEKYGGLVMLVDMRNGIGTTKLIDDIRKAENQ